MDKIIDGYNATTDSNHMWLAPWEPESGRPQTLTIDLPFAVAIGALRVWNYNKSEEDSYRGICRMLVTLDGELVSHADGALLRKAPGHDCFDHAQLVTLLPASAGGGGGSAKRGAPPQFLPHTPISQDYWTPVLPRGHIWQLRLLSTWGDCHYMGLDSLQLFGADGQELTAAGRSPSAAVYASPADVNVLANVSGDPRTIDKLFVPHEKVGELSAAAAAALGAEGWPDPSARRKSKADVWLAPCRQ